VEIDHRPRERRMSASIVVAMAISYGLAFGVLAYFGWMGFAGFAALILAVNIWYRIRYGEWMDYT
jgi:hypothetical protein